jgi:predicted ATPase
MQSLALEGGFPSALWAGPETLSRSVRQGIHPVQGAMRKGPVSLKLGFSSEDYGYAIDLGMPTPVPRSRFGRDPEIKRESLWTGLTLQRASAFAERAGPLVKIRDQNGAWRQAIDDLQTYDSMLTHCADPRGAPELLDLRESMRSWRFYDHFRTDSDAPARRPQVGARTPVLASDGSDLATAIATIQEIGAHDELDAAVADAFPGGAIDVRDADGYFEVEMRQHGLLRPLRASEFSDGTLRYLLLIAALMTPRPPPLMILNEPETSLHPDLMAPLARLVASASSRSQIIVVTHAAKLVASLHDAGARQVVLIKELGETVAAEGERPGWNWPSR